MSSKPAKDHILVAEAKRILGLCGKALTQEEFLKVACAFTMAKTAIQARLNTVSKNRQGGSKSAVPRPKSTTAASSRKRDLIHVQSSINSIANMTTISAGGSQSSNTAGGQSDEMTIAVMLEDEDTVRTVRVRASSMLCNDSLLLMLHIPAEARERLEFLKGGQTLLIDESFKNNGVVDGDRLTLRWPQSWSFVQVVDELVDLNPHLRSQREDIIRKAGWEEPCRDHGGGGFAVLNWDLRYMDISQLPPSFGHLSVEGDLNLSCNSLSSLPASFRYLQAAHC